MVGIAVPRSNLIQTIRFRSHSHISSLLAFSFLLLLRGCLAALDASSKHFVAMVQPATLRPLSPEEKQMEGDHGFGSTNNVVDQAVRFNAPVCRCWPCD